jgi:hypothetical protein
MCNKMYLNCLADLVLIVSRQALSNEYTEDASKSLEPNGSYERVYWTAKESINDRKELDDSTALSPCVAYQLANLSLLNFAQT